MGVSGANAGASAACWETAPRYRGIRTEAHLNGTPQGEFVLSVAEGVARLQVFRS